MLLIAAGTASLIALLGARPFAGGWNDGSRLATVEALVDHRTLAIDDSIFVQPWHVDPGVAPPYHAETPALTQMLLEKGTMDKLFIGGHWYSDKPPVPAVLLAGVYWLVQQVTGLTARHRPDVFCYLMTVTSSGLAFVAAVVSVLALSGRILPTRRQCILLTASFALGTVALAYTRQTNSHITFLARRCRCYSDWTYWHSDCAMAGGQGCCWRAWGRWRAWATSCDQGVGPMLLATLAPLIVYRLCAAPLCLPPLSCWDCSPGWPCTTD